MSFETIRYDVDGPAATITLNRPEKLNAFTAQMGVDSRERCAWPTRMTRSAG